MSKGSEGSSNAVARIVSGAVYFVVCVGCLYLGRYATAAIISVMATMCVFEFQRMGRMAGRMPNELIVYVTTPLYPLAALIVGRHGLLMLTYALIFACAAWFVMTPRATIGDVALTAFGPLYCGLTLSCLVMLRMSAPGHGGALLCFGIMGSIWLNDSFAYLIGSRFGRHKLAPRISPNKSVEGFWGGIAACVLTWVLMVLLHAPGITWPKALIVGPLVGVASVMGDLFESRIKRGVGVKDSGNVMPGHGGMLDRSDALIFGSMVAYMGLHIWGAL